MKHIRKFNESKKEAGRVLQEFSEFLSEIIEPIFMVCDDLKSEVKSITGLELSKIDLLKYYSAYSYKTLDFYSYDEMKKILDELVGDSEVTIKFKKHKDSSEEDFNDFLDDYYGGLRSFKYDPKSNTITVSYKDIALRHLIISR